MKKSLSVLLAIITLLCLGVFALTGCSSARISSVTSTSETTKETAEETTKATTEATTEATTKAVSDDEEDEEDVDEDSEDEDEESGEVDPELKAFLDSYEAFYDEYIDFIVKYNENPTDLTLMTEYTEMMLKLNEFQSATEKYDTDEMSEADRLYYIEVITRVEKKLLEASVTISD